MQVEVLPLQKLSNLYRFDRYTAEHVGGSNCVSGTDSKHQLGDIALCCRSQSVNRNTVLVGLRNLHFAINREVAAKRKVHVDCVEIRWRAKNRCREKFSIYLPKTKAPVEGNGCRLRGRDMQFNF